MRGLNRFAIGSVFLSGREPYPWRVSFLIVPDLTAILALPHPLHRSHFGQLAQSGWRAWLLDPGQQTQPIFTNRLALPLALPFTTWVAAVLNAPPIPLIPTLGDMMLEPLRRNCRGGIERHTECFRH